MLHRPTGDAGVHRETLALPERRDGIFVGIIAAAVIAQNEADAIRAAEPARSASHDLHHLVDATRHREIER